MGEAQTPHFYDFGVSEPVTKPQNQLFVSLETPGHLSKNQEKSWNILTNVMFINLIVGKPHILTKLEKTRAEK